MLTYTVEDTHKEIGLQVDEDDPRYWLYVDAISHYTGSGSRTLAMVLHRMYRAKNAARMPINKYVKHNIQMLDDIMWNHPLKKKLAVYHGSKESPLRIWGISGTPLDQPVRIHLPAFTSTSTNLSTARGFASSDNRFLKMLPAGVRKRYDNYKYRFNVLKIHLLPGMPALSVKYHSQHKSENEILLGRGTELIIQPNPQLQGPVAVWNCKVVYINPREYWKR